MLLRFLDAKTSEMTSAGKMVQYCDFETFQARCSAKNEVVVMVAASYGRRETGRCLPPDSVIESLRHDPSYFGCSADVLRLADHKCSGRPRCDIAIPDSDFERVTPCYKDSRKYLEANYNCVKGMNEQADARPDGRWDMRPSPIIVHSRCLHLC